MRQKLKYFFPLFFAVFSSLLYILIYFSSWEAEDYTTVLLVFFAAFGSSAIIVFRNINNRFFSLLLFFITVCLPIIYIEILKFSPIDPLWHRILIGLIILAFVILKLFISKFIKE
jgi:hypothetical protein